MGFHTMFGFRRRPAPPPPPPPPPTGLSLDQKQKMMSALASSRIGAIVIAADAPCEALANALTDVFKRASWAVTRAPLDDPEPGAVLTVGDPDDMTSTELAVHTAWTAAGLGPLSLAAGEALELRLSL